MPPLKETSSSEEEEHNDPRPFNKRTKHHKGELWDGQLPCPDFNNLWTEMLREERHVENLRKEQQVKGDETIGLSEQPSTDEVAGLSKQPVANAHKTAKQLIDDDYDPSIPVYDPFHVYEMKLRQKRREKKLKLLQESQRQAGLTEFYIIKALNGSDDASEITLDKEVDDECQFLAGAEYIVWPISDVRNEHGYKNDGNLPQPE